MDIPTLIKTSNLTDDENASNKSSLSVEMARGYFYKYKSLSDETLPHVIEIIQGRKVFCPKPSQTNDKDEEFKPSVSVGEFSDPAYKAQVLNWIKRISTRSTPHATQQEIQTQFLSLTQDHLEAYAKQLEPEYHQDIENAYRLISLSDTPSNHHLWLNYSDNYAGICFGFLILPTFSTVYKVKYVDTRPKWDLTSFGDMETLFATALVKLKKWEHEREFRMVISEKRLPYGPILINQKLEFPVKSFAGIFLGYKTKQNHKALILDLVKIHMPHIPIYLVEGGIPFRDSKISRIES